MKRIGLYSVLILILWGGGAWAYQPGRYEAAYVNPSDEGAIAEVGNFVKDLAVVYSGELERGVMTGDMSLYASGIDDLYLDQEREEKARMLTRMALRSIIRGTIEQVDLINTLKTYGQRLTTTRLDVNRDRVRLFGPSLRKAAAAATRESTPEVPFLSIWSGMSLTETIHPVPMIQARIAQVHSKLTYDPLAGGNWRFMVGHSFSARSAMEMVYLHRSMDDQDLLATLRLTF